MNKITMAFAAIGAFTMFGFGAVAVSGDRGAGAQTTATEAQTQTFAFDVENMTCATCPITVRTAMSRVDGVINVEVDFETKVATVEFDPAVATPEAIALASRNAGYPAFLQGEAHDDGEPRAHDHSG